MRLFIVLFLADAGRRTIRACLHLFLFSMKAGKKVKFKNN
ncbi:hypothetical protein Slin_4570 [Spirosoma linguale DSM 74]|uniref:Uncharacterized protein n=1 Tax=Spirosoma linguale (strain ATCC 33905 / DSM 74 / LMG 10896 / Claus 1) TaxID=504472 RepID=D2QNL3_SPILD|nr:hypothetical protein Slin_4570 [Spirosoma linguale DSM 74]